jgi:hypothetical protein
MWSVAYELIDGVHWGPSGQSAPAAAKQAHTENRLSQRALTFATRANRPRSFFFQPSAQK